MQLVFFCANDACHGHDERTGDAKRGHEFHHCSFHSVISILYVPKSGVPQYEDTSAASSNACAAGTSDRWDRQEF